MGLKPATNPDVEAATIELTIDGKTVTAKDGVSLYDVRVLGRAAHAGLEPHLGVNATVELAHQVMAVNALGRHDLGTTVTPTASGTGTTTNTVPAAGSFAATATDLPCRSGSVEICVASRCCACSMRSARFDASDSCCSSEMSFWISASS